jgi:hypothetical protein
VILGTIVGTAVIVAITIAIGLLADKKLGLVARAETLDPPRARPAGHALGEAPATAIRAGVAQLARLRASQRCRECRTLVVAGEPDDAIRYNERALAVLHFRCPACGRNQALYVEPTAIDVH